jgi:hypothetical protein
MIYFETDKEHCFLWPVVAVSLGDEFWLGLGWLNFELGWRSGDDGDGEREPEGRTA